MIDNEVYRYTELGIMSTDLSNAQALAIVHQGLDCSDILGQQGTLYFEGVELFIPVPIDDCYNGGGYNGPNNTSPISTSPVPPTKAELLENLQVCVNVSNFWDQILGPSKSCYDYSSDEHRIKTKAWSQNLQIFSDVGLKVKAQKKRFLGWSQQDIPELCLGYNYAEFTYEIPNYVPAGAPVNNPAIYYAVNGVWYNGLTGSQMFVDPSTLRTFSMFNTFPLDQDKRFVSIFLKQSYKETLINVMGVPRSIAETYFQSGTAKLKVSEVKLVNDALNSLVKNVFKQVEKNIGKKVEETTFSITSEEPDFGTLNFKFGNYFEEAQNTHKIKSVLAWNVFVNLNIGVGSNSGVNGGFEATPYKKFAISAYGLGYKNDQWRGSIVIIDK